MGRRVTELLGMPFQSSEEVRGLRSWGLVRKLLNCGGDLGRQESKFDWNGREFERDPERNLVWKLKKMIHCIVA